MACYSAGYWYVTVIGYVNPLILLLHIKLSTIFKIVSHIFGDHSSCDENAYCILKNTLTSSKGLISFAAKIIPSCPSKKAKL